MNKYKIMKMVNGIPRYSTGGVHPRWVTEGGKFWSKLGQLRSHLGQFITRAGENHVPEDWTILEFEIVPTDRTAPARDFAVEVADKRAERLYRNEMAQLEKQRQLSLSVEERELAELARLKAKYGKS